MSPTPRPGFFPGVGYDLTRRRPPPVVTRDASAISAGVGYDVAKRCPPPVLVRDASAIRAGVGYDVAKRCRRLGSLRPFGLCAPPERAGRWQ